MYMYVYKSNISKDYLKMVYTYKNLKAKTEKKINEIYRRGIIVLCVSFHCTMKKPFFKSISFLEPFRTPLLSIQVE